MLWTMSALTSRVRAVASGACADSDQWEELSVAKVEALDVDAAAKAEA